MELDERGVVHRLVGSLVDDVEKVLEASGVGGTSVFLPPGEGAASLPSRSRVAENSGLGSDSVQGAAHLDRRHGYMVAELASRGSRVLDEHGDGDFRWVEVVHRELFADRRPKILAWHQAEPDWTSARGNIRAHVFNKR